jgi:hypothetical protein
MDNFVPIKHHYVKNSNTMETLHDIGFDIIGNIGETKTAELIDFYQHLHDFKSPEGGMFYSIYSTDLEYRKKVHDKIGEILNDVFENYFTNYKSVVNSYIVKIAGDKSAFTLHQDTTGLDETKYSALSVWIALQDTTIENGCLCVVPKSHRMFHPYRGISFKSPFSEIEPELRKYLVPINMKAGEILAFDNRLVHYSPPNTSTAPRLVILSGIFPKEAKFEICYKEEHINPFAPIEIYEQADDYLLTNTTFFHNCTCKPETGVKRREIHLNLPSIGISDFEELTKVFDIKATNIAELTDMSKQMNIVSEPV